MNAYVKGGSRRLKYSKGFHEHGDVLGYKGLGHKF